jgi:3-oxoacyl-[acyl-carrier-protein] synthase-3
MPQQERPHRPTGAADPSPREKMQPPHAHPEGATAPYTSRFESLGLKLPERRRSMRELLDSCRHQLPVDLQRLTGIRESRVCSEGEDSYSLAAEAAFDCLSHSRHGPEDIEMLISCSITSYRGGAELFALEPSMGFVIKEAIGAGQALHFDVRNACAGMVTGVYILDGMIRSGAIRCGMVVSGEYISHLADNAAREVRSLRSEQLASLTVGDAGAAVILERADGGSPGISACELATYARHSDLCIGEPCPSAPGATMRTDAFRLHRTAIDSARPTLVDALDQSGISITEIDYLIPHQTSVRAIRAGTKSIFPPIGGLPKHIVDNLEEFGNTASTSHFVALYTYLQRRRFRAGDRILLLVFASGVVCGTLIFTMDELCENYGRDH